MAARNDYRMPMPEIGDDVWFRNDPSGPPMTARVVKIGNRAVHLFFFNEDGGYKFVDNVRYKSDPELANWNVAKQGQWEFSPKAIQQQQMTRLWPVLLESLGTDEAGLEAIIAKKAKEKAQQEQREARAAAKEKKAETEPAAEAVAS